MTMTRRQLLIAGTAAIAAGATPWPAQGSRPPVEGVGLVASPPARVASSALDELIGESASMVQLREEIHAFTEIDADDLGAIKARRRASLWYQ
jgi:hypothetical protein